MLDAKQAQIHATKALSPLWSPHSFPKTMSIAGRRVIILVEFNYEDLEVHYPLLRFK
jgi:hypothetical protein